MNNIGHIGEFWNGKWEKNSLDMVHSVPFTLRSPSLLQLFQFEGASWASFLSTAPPPRNSFPTLTLSYSIAIASGVHPLLSISLMFISFWRSWRKAWSEFPMIAPCRPMLLILVLSYSSSLSSHLRMTLRTFAEFPRAAQWKALLWDWSISRKLAPFF